MVLKCLSGLFSQEGVNVSSMFLNIWFIQSAKITLLLPDFRGFGVCEACDWFVFVVAVVGVVISGFVVIVVAVACFWDCRENVVIALVPW